MKFAQRVSQCCHFERDEPVFCNEDLIDYAFECTEINIKEVD